jgi:hypothetical protein
MGRTTARGQQLKESKRRLPASRKDTPRGLDGNTEPADGGWTLAGQEDDISRPSVAVNGFGEIVPRVSELNEVCAFTNLV